MNTRYRHYFGVLAMCFALVLAGCESETEVEDIEVEEPMPPMEMSEQGQNVATAQLEPTEGNNARGTITFTQLNGEVRVEGTISGLPEGMHGFHVHQNGDCSNNAQAAGGHFNPQSAQHGAPDASSSQRHVGDLGNIEAGADSTAMVSMTDSLIAFSGQNSIIGKAVVVHAGEDDLESQPSGDAGDRVACGVVEHQHGGMMQDTTGMGGM